MPIIAFVTDTASVTCMLQHLGEPSEPPRVAPPRGPPESAVPSDESPAFDPEAAGLPIRPDRELVNPAITAVRKGNRTLRAARREPPTVPSLRRRGAPPDAPCGPCPVPDLPQP